MKSTLTRILQAVTQQDCHRTAVLTGGDRTVPSVADKTQPARDRTMPFAERDTLGQVAAPGSAECTWLVIDTSSSMLEGYEGATSKIDAAGLAAQAFIVNKCQTDPHDHVGVIAFTSKARVITPMCALGDNRPHLIQSVRQLGANGGTDLGNAMRFAVAQFGPSPAGVTHRVVFITDGQGGDPTPSAEAFKASGGVIDCIGIGATPKDVDERLLRRAASVINGQSRYVFAKDMATLHSTLTAVSAKTQVH